MPLYRLKQHSSYKPHSFTDLIKSCDQQVGPKSKSHFPAPQATHTSLRHEIPPARCQGPVCSHPLRGPHEGQPEVAFLIKHAKSRGRLIFETGKVFFLGEPLHLFHTRMVSYLLPHEKLSRATSLAFLIALVNDGHSIRYILGN